MLQVGSTVSFGEKNSKKTTSRSTESSRRNFFGYIFDHFCRSRSWWPVLWPLFCMIRPPPSPALPFKQLWPLTRWSTILESLIKLDPFWRKNGSMFHKGFSMVQCSCWQRFAEPDLQRWEVNAKNGNEKLSRPVHPAARHFLLKMQIMLDTLGLCWPMLKLYM